MQKMISSKYPERGWHHDNEEVIIRRNVDQVIETLVQFDLDMMFEGFIAKHVKKTDDIIKGRPVIVNGYVRPGCLTAELNFSFADGSHFDMTCQVILKTSPRGKLFNQFPTTFHNAVRADGSKVSPASEANMKALFFKEAA